MRSVEREGAAKAGQGRRCSELSLRHPGAGCVYGAVSHVGEASPLGPGPPGRWENNSSFCQSFQGQGSDGHRWELEPAPGTHPVLHLNTGRIDTHTLWDEGEEERTGLVTGINIHAKNA